MLISLSGLSALIAVIGALVAVVNIIVEVIKKATWNKIPTNLMALAVSEVLTLAAFFAYCEISAAKVFWYTLASAVVVGFMVAYAAMFGYDKLKEALQGLGEAAKSISSENQQNDQDK